MADLVIDAAKRPRPEEGQVERPALDMYRASRPDDGILDEDTGDPNADGSGATEVELSTPSRPAVHRDGWRRG